MFDHQFFYQISQIYWLQWNNCLKRVADLFFVQFNKKFLADKKLPTSRQVIELFFECGDLEYEKMLYSPEYQKIQAHFINAYLFLQKNYKEATVKTLVQDEANNINETL